MDFSPLHEHVCMESSDHWLQGAVQEESGVMDSSSSSPPLMERRVRPAPTDQALKCPRCESTNTKFCYYNNYSLSQPRYFCKTCRRYWTKGGTLRNIPVGGGCRKNKKVSSKKFNDVVHTQSSEPKDLQLTSASSNFPDHAMHFPHPVGLMMENSSRLMETNFGGMINNVMGNIGDTGIITDQIHYSQNGSLLAHNFQGFGGNVCYFDGYNGNIGGTYSTMDSFYHGNEDVGAIIHDVKPNPKLLSLEWQDQQGCSDAGKDPFGYNINTSLGSWSGMINGYGASTTNPLI